MSLNELCQEKKPDLEAIKRILVDADGNLEKIDEVDSHGVTPLQHAAFRGNLELTKLLLAHGADVNSSRHTEGYTTLMFAALSGNCDIVEVVMDAGAKPDVTNKVNRNAAEMSSFVGHHDCAITIRGFIALSVFDIYQKNFKLNKKPALAPDVVEALRKLIMRRNVHPVKIAFIVKDDEKLRTKEVVEVLGHLSDTFFTKEHNEWLSGKIHFVKCVIHEVVENEADTIVKRWNKARTVDGFKLLLDTFIRNCVRSYKYHESEVFRKMVVTLANTSQEPMEAGDGAIELFLGSKPDSSCNTCWESTAASRCTNCKSVLYCDRACQKLDWSSHSRICASLKEAREASTESGAVQK